MRPRVAVTLLLGPYVAPRLSESLTEVGRTLECRWRDTSWSTRSMKRKPSTRVTPTRLRGSSSSSPPWCPPWGPVGSDLSGVGPPPLWSPCEAPELWCSSSCI
uniref:Putative secreted protein n=1 Tax=Ixodes ricinus TaxID=34613 RepID=A0A6B0UCK7_IXORI